MSSIRNQHNYWWRHLTRKLLFTDYSTVKKIETNGQLWQTKSRLRVLSLDISHIAADRKNFKFIEN